MAKKKAHDGGGETLQIVILTLFMTGGGFALISVVLALFLVPARADDLDQQIKDAKSLSELLSRQNQKSLMWDLRKRAREAEKSEGSANLRSRVESQLGPLQSAVTVFPATTERRIGLTREESSKIDFKDVKLQDVFNFVARVKQENPSVQVGQLRISRPPNTRSGPGGDEDKWSASATFYLYSTTSPGARGSTKAEAEAEAPAEEEPAEAEKSAGE